MGFNLRLRHVRIILSWRLRSSWLTVGGPHCFEYWYVTSLTHFALHMRTQKWTNIWQYITSSMTSRTNTFIHQCGIPAVNQLGLRYYKRHQIYLCNDKKLADHFSVGHWSSCNFQNDYCPSICESEISLRTIIIFQCCFMRQPDRTGCKYFHKVEVFAWLLKNRPESNPIKWICLLYK